MSPVMITLTTGEITVLKTMKRIAITIVIAIVPLRVGWPQMIRR